MAEIRLIFFLQFYSARRTPNTEFHSITSRRKLKNKNLTLFSNPRNAVDRKESCLRIFKERIKNWHIFVQNLVSFVYIQNQLLYLCFTQHQRFESSAVELNREPKKMHIRLHRPSVRSTPYELFCWT